MKWDGTEERQLVITNLFLPMFLQYSKIQKIQSGLRLASLYFIVMYLYLAPTSNKVIITILLLLLVLSIPNHLKGEKLVYPPL